MYLLYPDKLVKVNISYHSQHQSMLLIIEMERYIRICACALLYPAMHIAVTGSVHNS